jgi:triosephosphate isomerase (TIM)
MRNQIAAANWKMNGSFSKGKELLETFKENFNSLPDFQQIIIAVPYPYLAWASQYATSFMHIAAQNMHHQTEGAFTGEVSAPMLNDLGINYVILGHSERREYNNETDELLKQKVELALKHNLTPIFCCGEPLNIREAGTQNQYVQAQLQNAIFNLSADQIEKVVIAYEPIWAIGTGKTATAEQAQAMHEHIRTCIQKQYSFETSQSISILYGGSVKANNANEIFGQTDVDGGLVGGASLQANEFVAIVKSLVA